jgi:glutamine synthetase
MMGEIIMKQYTKQDIIRMVKEDDVEFIRLQFTDMFGFLKNVALTTSQLDRVLNNECIFDGSSIEGFARIEESDMYLYPDLNTYVTFPWRPQQGRVARLICDVYTIDGKPFEGDPRYILKKVIRQAEDMGYVFDVGPELEFFLFNIEEDGKPTTKTYERAGYFDLGPMDLGENARRDMVLTLEDMGIGVEASHHEVAPAQHEIDIKYDDALTTADNIMTFKLVARTIAKRHGLHATFMPKPKHGVDGSGMHVNMSLKKDGRNVFDDPDGKLGLSKEAYHFIAGIMKHMKGMAAITNPLVNSYKRLVPNYEAPVYIAWSASNRSPLIRVPAGRGSAARLELRCPDPCANPYLMLAVCLAAGLDGIKNELMPPDSMDMNLFSLSDKERLDLNIENLPESLIEAVKYLDENEFIKNVMGSHISRKYIDAKKAEWDQYRTQVSQWELDQYLYRF